MSDNQQLVDFADQIGIIQDTLAVILRQQFATERTLIQILSRLGLVQLQENQNMASFQELQQQVTRSDNVMDGAVQLLSSISQMLQEAKDRNTGDPAATAAAIDQVISDLNQRTEALASALVKNTPVDPNPTPTPTPASAPTPAPTPDQPAPPVDQAPAPAPTSDQPAPPAKPVSVDPPPGDVPPADTASNRLSNR